MAAGLSCGAVSDSSDDGSSEFQKIAPAEQSLQLDDFLDAGFKESKEYDVEGLPDATEAWMGFWGLSASERKDYELRFYPSHDLAVESGGPLADEATGEEFREKKESQTWTEGQKDRWRAGNVTAGSTRGTTGPGPVYGDFAIIGNVVLLCQGSNSAQSLERCEALIDALGEMGGA